MNSTKNLRTVENCQDEVLKLLSYNPVLYSCPSVNKDKLMNFSRERLNNTPNAFGTINVVLAKPHIKDNQEEEKWKVYCFVVDRLHPVTFFKEEKVAP